MEEIYKKVEIEWSYYWFENILKYPINSWNYDILSMNSNVILEVVIKYPKFKWNWTYLVSNLDIFIEILEKQNPNIDYYDHFITYQYTENDCENYIYKNKLLNLLRNKKELLKVLINEKNVFKFFSFHKKLKQKIVEKLKNKKWNYGILSYNPNIYWDFIVKNLNKEWNWHELTIHKNITMDIIMDNKDKPWNYDKIYYNPNFVYDKHNIFFQNIKWKDYVYNKNFCYEDIKKIGIEEDDLEYWFIISCHKNITLDIILKNKNPWINCGIVMNPNITMEMIELHYKHKLSSYIELSRNPNITWEFIDNHLDNIHIYDWYALSDNNMTKEKDIFFEKNIGKYYNEWFVKSGLKREYMKYFYHPMNMNKWKDL